jgi:hypothetical protein
LSWLDRARIFQNGVAPISPLEFALTVPEENLQSVSEGPSRHRSKSKSVKWNLKLRRLLKDRIKFRGVYLEGRHFNTDQHELHYFVHMEPGVLGPPRFSIFRVSSHTANTSISRLAYFFIVR